MCMSTGEVSIIQEQKEQGMKVVDVALECGGEDVN